MDKNIKIDNKYLEEKISAFKNICYDNGMRITPQRIAIYKELITSQKHPSAIMIYDKVRSYFPNISLGTVNSTLLTFAEIGLTKVLESSGDPKRFDPNLKAHHHFRCIKCGRIIDFYNEDFNSIEIPDELKERFIVLDKKVHLEGICNKCRANEKN